ncbi:uncharacterized protein RCC_04832 [Ramularia collo-cygni]|uniref:PH domain protein n=1 Tax=Ramularia collo-cygni TaxID=112498 RepID=A0A2D3V2S9_9PEZI|nr:uncharacterized protein RCC_04832 [Ramularia collo-cygni]CZT18987.1 uncharacterized protein RCC_04832 [Ramularia collo-cygni]
MAGAVGKYAANKLLKKQMAKYESKKPTGGQDPYFAMVEDPRKPGKLKKVKKQIPSYIPENDAMILASFRKNAYHLDCSLFSLFGMRFGWESVIGIVPAIGDAIGAALALLLVRKTRKLDGGIDTTLVVRMLINVAIDFLVGLVPFIGDLADAAFKANTKNLRLLEEHLDNKYKPSNLKFDDRDFVGVDKERRKTNRKSGIYMPNDPPPATVFEDSDVEDDRYHSAGAPPSRVDGFHEPRPAYATEERRGGERAGVHSSGGSRTQPPRR